MIELRPYQERAFYALIDDALERGEHPICAMATGGGKSIVIGVVAHHIGGRVLVVTHRKELLEQNERALELIAGEEAGVYSAGLSRREGDARVIFGGLQSVYSRIDELQESGKFEAIIVDECHRCPPPSVASMYRTIFEACPGALRIGFSATPYRLDNGLLHEGDDRWFTTMPVNVGIRDLTDAGYLSPLVGLQSVAPNLEGVRVRTGDYAVGDLSQALSVESVIEGAADEICRYGAERGSWLVFCVDVAHTLLVASAIERRGILVRVVLGSTPADERSDILRAFRAGEVRALVNCEVATTGFDIPGIDLVAMLRPTMSKSLAVQMLGRGTRLADGKENCLVLDLAGNIERHRPIDGMEDIGKTQKAQAEEAAEEKAKEERRQREVDYAEKHGRFAAWYDPMGDDVGRGRQLKVIHMTMKVVQSRKYPDRENVMIGYKCLDEETEHQGWVNTWLCPEYPGRAREFASLWFTRRGLEMPARAQHIASQFYRRPTHILVKREGGYDRVAIEYFDGLDAA